MQRRNYRRVERHRALDKLVDAGRQRPFERCQIGDESGTVAIIAAVTASVLIGVVGLGLDMAQLSSDVSRHQNVLDAAALAAAKEDDGAKAAHRFRAHLLAMEVKPGLASMNYSKKGQEVEVRARLNTETKTTLSQVVGIDKLPFALAAVAVAPLRINEVEIQIKESFGWYAKTLYFKVERSDGTVETVATAQYTPTNFKAHNGRGTGHSRVTPSERVVVPEYEDFWLELHVRDLSGRTSIYSTKDPRMAHHLFVDGRQLPAGSKPPIGKFMPCGRTVSHDWEDGGNFNTQDMFFDIKTICETPDGTKVRLVR